jgi:molecular chaperone GrpE
MKKPQEHLQNVGSAQDAATAQAVADETSNETKAAAREGAGSNPPPEQLDDLKARAAKADEHWERLVRTMADFDNFKKRAARERQDAVRFANEALLEKLLPVLDNFEMAQAAAQASPDNAVQSLQQGISMIQQQLKSTLAEAGLEEVDAAGKRFDPNLHEAVAHHETDETPEDHVHQQLRKGYKLRDRLLRPATVIVAKQPASDSAH